MKDYQQLLVALKEVGDVDIPMDPKFYERLHAKIMNEVEEAEIKPCPLWLRSKKYLQAHWKSWFVHAAPRSVRTAQPKSDQRAHLYTIN